MQITLNAVRPHPQVLHQLTTQVADPAQLISVTGDIARLAGLPGAQTLPAGADQTLVPLAPQQTGLTPKQYRQIGFKLAKRTNQGLKLAKVINPQLGPGVSGLGAVLSSYEAWEALTEKEKFSPLNAGLKTGVMVADVADFLMLFQSIATVHPQLAGAVQGFGLFVRGADTLYGGFVDVRNIVQPS